MMRSTSPCDDPGCAEKRIRQTFWTAASFTHGLLDSMIATFRTEPSGLTESRANICSLAFMLSRHWSGKIGGSLKIGAPSGAASASGQEIGAFDCADDARRSEVHTSELQSQSN